MSKKALNKIATHPLQTSYWADFRSEWGNEIIQTIYGILTAHKIPKTKYKIGAFIKGPKPTATVLKDLKKIAAENNLISIKLEPNIQYDKKLVSLLRKHGAVKGKTLFTPTTFQIDLTKSEEKLLKSFHSKTRYNIRLSERKGVTTAEDNSKKAFDKYIELTRRTVHHQGFYSHNENYHRLMWKHLHKAGVAHLLTAMHKSKIITTWVVFIWKDTLYYPYGASDERHRNLMASNLMMWEAIKFGKKNKLKTFDLWGREPGKGFTKFKEGYNPEVVEFLGSWDLIVNKKMYYAYRAAETLRWGLLRTKSKFIRPGF